MSKSRLIVCGDGYNSLSTQYYTNPSITYEEWQAKISDYVYTRIKGLQ